MWHILKMPNASTVNYHFRCFPSVPGLRNHPLGEIEREELKNRNHTLVSNLQSQTWSTYTYPVPKGLRTLWLRTFYFQVQLKCEQFGKLTHSVSGDRKTMICMCFAPITAVPCCNKNSGSVLYFKAKVGCVVVLFMSRFLALYRVWDH